ncbi:unnamed protein product [Prunus armeniaca]
MSDETWPFQSMNRCHGQEEVPSDDRDLFRHKHCPHIPGFFGRGLGRGRMDSKGWTLCLPPDVIEVGALNA